MCEFGRRTIFTGLAIYESISARLRDINRAAKGGFQPGGKFVNTPHNVQKFVGMMLSASSFLYVAGVVLKAGGS